MPKYFTTYWQWPYWHDNGEGTPCDSSGSNLYKQRGVEPGDVVYVLSNNKGTVHLGGRMTVAEVVSRRMAVKKTGISTLYEDARWWILGAHGATPLRLGRSLDRRVAAQLNFMAAGGRQLKGLFFDAEGRVDRQSLRGVRRLDDASAQLFDDILRVTDALPGPRIAVTPGLLRRHGIQIAS